MCTNRYTKGQIIAEETRFELATRYRATVFKTAWRPLPTLPFFIQYVNELLFFYYAIIYETHFREPNLSEKKDSNLFELIRVLNRI